MVIEWLWKCEYLVNFRNKGQWTKYFNKHYHIDGNILLFLAATDIMMALLISQNIFYSYIEF